LLVVMNSSDEELFGSPPRAAASRSLWAVSASELKASGGTALPKRADANGSWPAQGLFPSRSWMPKTLDDKT
jgi:hypothetical protein